MNQGFQTPRLPLGVYIRVGAGVIRVCGSQLDEGWLQMHPEDKNKSVTNHTQRCPLHSKLAFWFLRVFLEGGNYNCHGKIKRNKISFSLSVCVVFVSACLSFPFPHFSSEGNISIFPSSSLIKVTCSWHVCMRSVCVTCMKT